MRTYVRMGDAGRSSWERKGLQTALRGRDADRVLRAASSLAKLHELTLADAAAICSHLAALEPDSERTSRAAARLAARISLASDGGLAVMDELLDLVANLPDADRLTKLLIYARRADDALRRPSPTSPQP